MGSKRVLMPRWWGLMGKGPDYRDCTPPTSSAPLYRLNHSKSLVGRTGEPRELWTLSECGKGRRGISTTYALHLSGKGMGHRTSFSRPVRIFGSRGREAEDQDGLHCEGKPSCMVQRALN
ncbi:hypothetical protein Lal_00012908 [Lupinus albus]|nr:hypothetical protein Lal_00012908 [Lupinus albus]